MTRNQQKKFARAERLLKKHFGEIEIADAKDRLIMPPVPKDFDTAVPGDPQHCGFANCALRVLNADDILFFKNATYIKHRGTDGVMRVYRYIPSAATKRAIAAFDTGTLSPEQMLRAFVLLPPAPSKSLEGQRAFRRVWRKKPSGRAIENHRHATLKVKGLRRDLDNEKEHLQRLEQRYSPDAPSVVEVKAQVKKLRERLSLAVEDEREKKAKADAVRNQHVGQGTSRPSKRRVINQRGGMFFWQSHDRDSRHGRRAG